MEYQYYEFQALDRPLTAAEQDYLRGLSSRVEPTATQAIFTYSYGDFRGDPKRVLEKCFDLMLYMANWGTRQLMVRLPRQAVNLEALETYCFGDQIGVSVTPQNAIVNIEFQDEEGLGWIEGEGWLTSFVPLRQALLEGDYRVLYLAWLEAAHLDEENEEENLLEPPVPPNLKTLSGALQSFVDWLQMDPDLITAAAETSPTLAETTAPVEAWVAALTDVEKNSWLVRVARGEPSVSLELMANLRQRFAESQVDQLSIAPQRTLAELLELAEIRQEQRLHQEQRAADLARTKYLDALAPRAAELWDTVFELVAQKQAQPYDQAVSHLIDLRDLAQHQERSNLFQHRLQQIWRDYSNRPGFLRRLEKAKLTVD